MQAFLSSLFAIYFFASSAVLVCVAAAICLITAPFDPLRKTLHEFACYWAFHYLQINPFWRVTFEGLDNIDGRKHYVLIANHQSYMDIFVLYGLHRSFKWVSKEEILKTPFIGWNMLLNQYVFIRRGDMKSIKEMMQECRDWLNKGASIMMFPEGTRSEDGQLQAFRDGAFKLAIDCNVDVVPIVIDGTHEIMGKNSRLINFTSKVRVKVLAPISPNSFDRSSGKMRTNVHNLMADELANMRGQANSIQPASQTDAVAPVEGDTRAGSTESVKQ
jgi:1-acyl-sn-glycerol-3-phosphate acyltransferase